MAHVPGKSWSHRPTRHLDRRTRTRRLQVERLEDRSLPSTTIVPNIQVQPTVTPLASPGAIAGYAPAQIQSAYGFSQIGFLNGNYSSAGSGQTIAIVDAYNDPNLQADLATFDAQYGLPAANLSVVSQTGSTTNLPATNAGWAQEISLDVEWAHAMAPAANIVLVEASSSSISSLMAAVQYASSSQVGASVVSMSWGSSEFTGESTYNSYFTTPGITYVASAGDMGGVTSFPAVSPNVLSVGGSTLTISSTGAYSSESAWSGGGGGASSMQTRPSYQSNYLNGGGLNSLSPTVANNGKLLSPDVSYDANPSTGFAVYDSLPYNRQSGWMEFGGTSAGAPQWAALVAIADQGRALSGQASLSTSGVLNALYNPSTYSTNFHDVTSGKSGKNSAGLGFDLATGLGTPRANQIVLSLQGVSPAVSAAASGSGAAPGSATTFGGRALQVGPTAPISGIVEAAAMTLPSSSLVGFASPLLVDGGTRGMVQPGFAVVAAPGLALGPTANVSVAAAPFVLPSYSGTFWALADITGPSVPDGTEPAPAIRNEDGDLPVIEGNIAPGPVVQVPRFDEEWREALDRQFMDDAVLAGDTLDQEEVLLPTVLRTSASTADQAILTAALALGMASFWDLRQDQELSRQEELRVE